MTNQPKDNEWIYSAREEQYEFGKSTCFEDFRKAIEDNLPKSISREAVEKLREKYDKLGDLFYEDEGSILHRINPVSDLNDLLGTNPQDEKN